MDSQITNLLNLLENPKYYFLFLALMVWNLIWKGIALWKAARNTHKAWFVIMLIVNTVGILEIIYIYGFSKNGQKNMPTGMNQQM